MTDLHRKRALALYKESPGPARALLVDRDDELQAALTAAGAEVGVRQPQIAGRPYDAEDLWFGAPPEHYRLVLLARRKMSKALFRDLSICARLVSPGGVIAIACLADAVVDHSYQEATEILLAAEPGWTRTLHQTSNLIELRRMS